MQANKKSAPVFVRAGDAVSKQSKMKMMLTVKAYLEVMMLHQIGRKWIWCQQKSSGIEECCWHQGRILLRWYSIFQKPPSHHHEKASKRYSIGMSGAENHHHDYPTSYGICECRHVELKNPPSCLWRGNSEISTAGTVSALKRHRAYENSHNPGWTVGTMTRIWRQRAYKIERDRRHDHHFSIQPCLRSSLAL